MLQQGNTSPLVYSELKKNYKHKFVGKNSFLNFLRTGGYYRSNGGIIERDTAGYWWSPIVGSAEYSHFLVTYLTYVNPLDSHYRGHGFAVRCVVREG